MVIIKFGRNNKIIIQYIRSSSVSEYELCSFKYTLSYILGIRESTHPKALLGTITHYLLQILAECKKCKQEGLEDFSDTILGKVKVGELFNQKFINKSTKKIYDYYIEKENLEYNFTQKDYDGVVDCINTALTFQDGAFDVRKRNIIDVEKFFNIEIKEDWAKYKYNYKGKNIEGNLRLKGTIDLIVDADGVIENLDWKTSSSTKSWSKDRDRDYKDFYDDFQLRLYHYVISLLYPEYETVASTIFFLRLKKPITIALSKSDLPETLNIIKEKFLTIKNNNRPKLKMGRKHWFCKYVCRHFKTPHPKDQTKSICEYCYDKMLDKGIDQLIEDDITPGFMPDYYQDPGV